MEDVLDRNLDKFEGYKWCKFRVCFFYYRINYVYEYILVYFLEIFSFILNIMVEIVRYIYF